MAVNVHFNCFIDLTINSHTNPYNLASAVAYKWLRAHIAGFVGRRIFPPYVFLVHTNGTLGDRNFSALLLKRLNRNDIGLRLTPKHPAARERKWKTSNPESEPKYIAQLTKILYQKTNFKKVGFSTRAFTDKILSWRFSPLNIVGCLLKRRPT